MDEKIKGLMRDALGFTPEAISQKIRPDETTNILLLSSARAGGTFFGKLLNDIFPDSFYTFNPLFVASFSQVSHIHYSNSQQVLYLPALLI